MEERVVLDGAVTMSPAVLGGAPVFFGTRVPVENLLDFLAGGYDLDGFLRTFPRVKRKHAQRVLDESSAALLAELGTKAA